MLVYLFILLCFLGGDLLWWRWSDRHLRPLRWNVAWRGVIGVFAVFQIAYVLMKVSELVLVPPRVPVLIVHMVGYLWHILILPLFLASYAIVRMVQWIRNRKTHRPAAAPSPAATPQEPPPLTLSRRDLLGAAAAVTPVFACAGLTALTARELSGFDVSRVDLAIPGLPADLDGLKIVHLSDLHIGQFLPRGMDRRVADAANALEADLVAFTGDLLDVSARSVQPGIDFIRMLNPRHGLALIEGNHDGMGRQAAGEFEDTLQSAGLPLLLNQARSVRIPGRTTPVQFLGEAWGQLKTGKEQGHWGKSADYRFRVRDDDSTRHSMSRLSNLRQPDSFPILLAHHPHTFDLAAAAGFPLTLAGHTHGGQLMLSKNVGVGPMRFRYWNGAYKQGISRLFVNRGIGSWFPLRVNAPAQIALLTLQRED